MQNVFSIISCNKDPLWACEFIFILIYYIIHKESNMAAIKSYGRLCNYFFLRRWLENVRFYLLEEVQYVLGKENGFTRRIKED